MREVYPITDGKKLLEIMNGLKDHRTEHEKRIYLLFATGIYTGLRIGDIIGLTAGQVNNGDKIRLVEEKTGKTTVIKICKQLRAIYDFELDGLQDNDFLFPSRQRDRRGRIKHITTDTAENDMKKIAYWFHITFPFSCHSLRKTFGYWHFQQNRNLPMLAKRFNHSDIRVTARYIGLDEHEMLNADEKVFDGVLPVYREAQARKRSNQVNDIVYTRHHDRTKQKAAYCERMKKYGLSNRDGRGRWSASNGY